MTSGYISYIKTDGESFAVAASLGLGKPVPSCPKWDVADLVRHLGEVHRHVAGRIREGNIEVEYPVIVEPPSSNDLTLIAWFREGLEELIDALVTYPLDRKCWTWANDPTVAFWHRRMAHETAVHRWDAENATSRARPIAASLAPDGIDELFDLYLWEEGDPLYEGREGRIGFRATDAGRDWVLELEEGSPCLRGDLAMPVDLTLRGPASDLMLLLWGRPVSSHVRSEGDKAVWGAFKRYMTG